MRFSITKKLNIGFLSVSLLIVLAGCLGLYGMYRVHRISQYMEDVDHTLWELAEIQSIGAHQIDMGVHFLFLGHEERVRGFREAGETFRNKLLSLLSEAPQLQGPLNKVASAHADLERIFYSLEEECRESGGAGFSTKVSLHEQWHSYEERLLETIKGARLGLVNTHVEAYEGGAKVIRNTVAATIGSALCIFLVAGAVGFYISKKISKPILELKDAAVRIGRGKLDTRVTVHTRDEIEGLGRELNRMAARLSESYATLEERVRQRTRDLEKERLRLEMLFSGISATGTAVAVIGMDHRVVFMNDHAVKIFGATAPKMNCYQVLHNLSEPCSDCVVKRVLNTGETLKLEDIKLRGRIFNIWAAPLRDTNGNVSCIEVFHDITDLKRAEKEVKEAREKAELILKTMPSGLMTVDLNQRITSWNKYAEVITGISADEAIGQKCISVFDSDVCHKECLLYSKEVDKPVFDRECMVTVKGRSLTVSKNIEYLRDSKGAVAGGLETFVDITYRKHMENRLVKSERYKTIIDISRNIAHNFNNMLTTIKGNVQLLLMNKNLTSDADIKFSLDEIHERTDEMTQLVSDMQYFAKYDEIYMDEKTDIVSVAKTVVKMLRPLWKNEMQKKGVDVDIVLECADVPHVRGGRQDYHTVFKNILLNAIEAMTRSGRIRIGASRVTESNAEFVRVTICDEGRGMDEVTHSRALEPLFSTKNTVGVGMGLTVAYGTVQKMGGTLTIESKPEKGTTVTVTVPVADTESLSACDVPEKQHKKTAPGKKNCQILVAEDEEPVRIFLTRLMQKMGHKVTGASNGVEALKVAKDKRFDLAFVDWAMPHMSGVALAHKLSETCSGMPVVMVTGWSDRENLESLSSAGIDNIITKPFDVERVKEIIERLV